MIVASYETTNLIERDKEIFDLIKLVCLKN